MAFDFSTNEIPIRHDLSDAFEREWNHLASPGATMTGAERVDLARAAREFRVSIESKSSIDLSTLAGILFVDPGSVDESLVRAASEATSDAQVVEAIGIVSRLAAVDGFHRAMGLPLASLPAPEPGEPTAAVTDGMKRRSAHVPIGVGPIPNSLDLVPAEGAALEAIHGPQYMAYDEMEDQTFRREPGLNRGQMELVSSLVSIHNECFY